MVTCSGQRLAAARRMVLPRGAGTARRLSSSGCKIYGHPAPQWHVRVACPARLRRTGAPAPLPAPPVEARTPLMRDPVFLGLSLVFRRRCSQRFLRWSRGQAHRPQSRSRCCRRSTPRSRTSTPRRRPETAGSRPGHPLAGGKPQARACRPALRSRAFRQVTVTPGAAPAAAALGMTRWRASNRRPGRDEGRPPCPARETTAPRCFPPDGPAGPPRDRRTDAQPFTRAGCLRRLREVARLDEPLARRRRGPAGAPALRCRRRAQGPTGSGGPRPGRAAAPATADSAPRSGGGGPPAPPARTPPAASPDA